MKNKRINIKRRIRKKIFGTANVPRLSVFRSNKAIYAQLIDDNNGLTIASASSSGLSGSNKSEIAKQVGIQIGEKAKNAQVEKVVFDRNGYLYHGRVKALADGARESGLNF